MHVARRWMVGWMILFAPICLFLNDQNKNIFSSNIKKKKHIKKNLRKRKILKVERCSVCDVGLRNFPRHQPSTQISHVSWKSPDQHGGFHEHVQRCETSAQKPSLSPQTPGAVGVQGGREVASASRQLRTEAVPAPAALLWYRDLFGHKRPTGV